MRKFVRAMCHPGAQSAIGSIMVLLLTIALIACGGDSGTSPSDVIPDSVPGSPSSSSVKKLSSSSVTRSSSSVIQSGDSREGSSNSKQSSSSSSKVSSSSSAKATSSSSSSVIPASSGNLPSSSSKKVESSSSQKIASSSSVSPASSSSKKESSSSEYIPFDHSKTHAADWEIGENRYKTFVDPRNGRSYYYITIPGRVFKEMGANGKAIWIEDTVTVMAENLNIGKMVLGENDQNDDGEIERYCYNNDTTYCDEFGGLYQWAEMMQLPSRCNTESCAELIQENHRGICPEGWRLLTWDDYVIIRQYEDKYDEGISGLRSQCFNGTNTSGFSIIGAGIRTADGKFESLSELAAWFRPEEYESDAAIRAHHGMMSSLNSANPSQTHRELKVKGFSVRCVKLE